MTRAAGVDTETCCSTARLFVFAGLAEDEASFLVLSSKMSDAFGRGPDEKLDVRRGAIVGAKQNHLRRRATKKAPVTKIGVPSDDRQAVFLRIFPDFGIGSALEPAVPDVQ